MYKDKCKLNDEVINSLGLKLMADLTIHDAALWMVMGIDRDAHEDRCDSDPEYLQHYCDQRYGEAYVLEICGYIQSALATKRIKPTRGADIKTPHLNIDATYISKASWLKWCRKKGYLEKIHLTSQLDAIGNETESINNTTSTTASNVQHGVGAIVKLVVTDEYLAKLFDPVTVAVLEKMFPAGEKWKGWAERAKRTGLEVARDGRAKFNPYKAAMWFVQQNVKGYDLARCRRTLGNSLPTRSMNYKDLLMNEFS